MRKPSHIRDLENAGKTYGDLCRFRSELEPQGITVAWNLRQRCWIIGQIPQCVEGAIYVCHKCGLGTLLDMMNNPAQVVADFERMAKQADSHFHPVVS